MEILVIGLTGGIASGKSTVTKILRAWGVPVIDADQLARESLRPQTAAWQAVVDHFGPAYNLPNGQLNRAALRERIFLNPEDKHWLETLLHPLIHDLCLKRLSALPKDTPYAVLEIPLLLESKISYPTNQIWVVDCSPETQIQRLQERDHTSVALAKHILTQQLSRDQRLAKADVIINGELPLPLLIEKIHQLHEKTRKKAKKSSSAT